MTSLQIEYFLKTAEQLSFSKAAQELYVSQPSVSRQIHQLEKELGYTLFDRSCKNSVSLTAAGMVFRDTFARAVGDLEQAQQAAAAVSRQAQLTLNVGVGSGWDLSAPLQQFRQHARRLYPHAEITFECSDFRDMRSRVHSGSLDAMICTKTSLISFDNLEVVHIADFESRAYVRRGLLCPEHEPLQLKHFGGQSLWMLDEKESPMAMEYARIVFQAAHVQVSPVYAPNRDTILQALLLGDGVAVFDQYMRFADDPRLTWLRLDDSIPICVAWRQDNRNPLLSCLADELRQYGWA